MTISVCFSLYPIELQCKFQAIRLVERARLRLVEELLHVLFFSLSVHLFLLRLVALSVSEKPIYPLIYCQNYAGISERITFNQAYSIPFSNRDISSGDGNCPLSLTGRRLTMR